MNMAAATTAEEGPPHPLAGGDAAHFVPSWDRFARWRRAGAIAAALVLHAALLALLLLRPMEQEPAPPISVELVAAAPPPAAPPATPAAAQAPAPKAAPSEARSSGGESSRTAGRSPDAKAPESPEPAPVATPAKETAEAAPSAEGGEAALPLEPLPTAKPELQAKPPAARTAAVAKPPARSPSESAVPGMGGGDRYLNALRDEIERNRVYPPEARARGLTGTAQYDMLLDRRGRLMHVRLLRSSGADVLDKAGVAMIERSAPFQPPPPELIGEVVDLVVTLHLAP